jgi:hypothetical protein
MGRTKTILRLPDLEQSKNAVLNSLAAASSQESYAHAIDEFIGWPRMRTTRVSLKAFVNLQIVAFAPLYR